jgi:tetratricopeptide (TPR) repeat protein
MGTKALARSAYREAVAGFDQALLALGHLPESRDTLAQAIDLRFDLRIALNPLREDRRLLDCLREAEPLAETLGDQRRLGQVSAYLAQYFWGIGDYEPGLASAQRALAIATGHGDIGLTSQAHLFLAMIFYAQGRYRQAIACLKKNVVALEGPLRYETLGQTGLPAVVSRAVLAWCAAELGAFAEGMGIGEDGVRIAEEAGQSFSLAQAYLGMGFLFLRKGDLSQAIPVLDRGLGLCQTYNISAVLPRIAAALGAAYTLSERFGDAIPLLEQAVERGASMRFMADYALHLAWLSEGYVLTGRLEDAHALAGRARDLSGVHREQGHKAWVLWLLGEIAAHWEPPQAAQAEAHYQQALALAEELGMRPLQAHCHRGIGTLCSQTGRAALARTALSSAIELYRAMDMTFWLPAAEAALAQVEGQ